MRKARKTTIIQGIILLAQLIFIYRFLNLRSKIRYKPIIPNDDSVIIISGNSSKDYFQNKINILVWNSYKAKKRGFFENLNNLLENHNLLLLQEHYMTEELLENIELYNYRELVTAVSFFTRKEIATGVCTISNVKHKSSSFIRSFFTEPVLKTPKMALVTIYSLGNDKEICVINVHGINFVRHRKFERQIKQIEDILSNFNGPIILGGDFNTWNRKRALILNELTSIYGLRQVKFENDFRRLKLDRVYIRDLNIKKAEILNNIKSSDHKPLSIEVELIGQNPPDC